MDLHTTTQMLGDFGEFFGAIAVVVTLVYLAAEVRQNGKQIQNQIDQTNYSQWANYLNITGGSAQVAALLRKGLRSMTELSEDEEAQFFSLLTLGLNSVEHQFQQMDDPMHHPDSSTMWEIANYFLAHRGGREYWAKYGSVYTASFIQWVESRLAEEKSTS